MTIIVHARGRPAAFAGGEPERRWKEVLRAALPPADPGCDVRGLRVAFTLPTPTPGRPGADLDNLLDPVLSVLVNERGWFGKFRTNIQFVHATKTRGTKTGCVVEILTSASPLAAESPFIDATYDGALPASARDRNFAEWVGAQAHSRPHAGIESVRRFADRR